MQSRTWQYRGTGQAGDHSHVREFCANNIKLCPDFGGAVSMVEWVRQRARVDGLPVILAIFRHRQNATVQRGVSTLF